MLMSVTLGLMALGCASVAVRGLVSNRPYLFSPTLFLAALVAVFAANFGLAVRQMLEHPLPGGALDMAPVVLPALLATAAVLLFVQFRGFIAIGVSGPLFREALFVSIKKLGLPFEQHFSVVRLPSAHAEIRMSVQNWIGMAQIKLRTFRGGRVVRDIARAMNHYFQSRKIATYQIASVYYLALALMLAIMAYQLRPGE
jgi:hypothetical protein